MSDRYDSAAFAAGIEQLDEIALLLHARGWTPATSSNFSFRLGPELCAVTASGGDKRRIRAQDLLVMDLAGRRIDGPADARPSAETGLHLALYRRDPGIGAVLHTHAPSSVLVTRLRPEADSIDLEGYELLKAFSGIDTHASSVRLPVVDNDQDIDALAARADAALDRTGPATFAYLIRSHGIYAWGEHLGAALRHLEAADYLLDLELQMARLSRA